MRFILKSSWDSKYRHDMVRDVIFDICRHAGISAKKEAPVKFLTDPSDGRSTLRPLTFWHVWIPLGNMRFILKSSWDSKYRHDMVRDVIFDICRHAGISAKKEAPVKFLTDPSDGRSTLRPLTFWFLDGLEGNMRADDQAIQTILLGLSEDIYATVDSCETAQEIWLRVQPMMKALTLEFRRRRPSCSTNGKETNTFQRRLPAILSRHVTIVHQTKDLHTADYTQLYEFLKYNQKEVDELKAERHAKTQDPLALMANSNNPYAFLAPHQNQSSFNQNYLQKPMPNPEDIINPTIVMNMVLALMAKAFKQNYSSPTNNNQRISSNPRNRQNAQPGINMGQDRQMQMVGGQNAGNLTGYNDVQNMGNQVIQNVVQNPRVQNIGNPNGLIGVQGNGNQNQIGNGNLVAARTEGNAVGQNGNQIRCYNCMGVGHYARNYTVRPRRRDAAYLQTHLLIAQKEEAGIQLQAEEYDLMAAAADLDEIEEVNVNCILMANLQQASTSGTQSDKAPIYDSDGSAEVHEYENCYDNEIFNMFTQEEQYTKLLEPIPEQHEVPQNDNNVISKVSIVEQGGEIVEQHLVNFKETRALYDSLYQNLAIEVEKVNSVNRKLKETNADLTTELARFKNQEKCFEISQEKYDKLERCYQQSVYQEQCLSKKINDLYLSTGKQKMTLNEQTLDLNKELSKEKSTVSFLLEEKKKLKSNFKIRDDKLLDEQIQLEKKIKELNNILVKTGQSIQTIHMLSPKPDSFYHTEQKMALGYQNPFYLKQAQKKQQSLYDGKVLLEKHDPPGVHDSEETLQLAQESREKIKQLNKEIKPANYTKINHLSGEAAKFVGDFKSLTNEVGASLAKHKALELEIELVSQDIMIIVQNESVVDTSDLQTELERMFRINPFKTSGEEKHVPNTVSSSARTKPITVSQPPVITKKYVNSDLNGLSSTGVDNTKTRRPQPKSTTKHDRVPSTSKSSRRKNKEAEVEEHHRILLLSKNNKHISSACNNIKIDSQDVISKVVCAMCNKCLISVNHDKCLCNYVNGKNSSGKKQKAKVSFKENQMKYQPKVTNSKKVESHKSLATPKPRKSRLLLRWSPTGRLFDQEGKIINSHKSDSQSDCVNDLEVAFRRNASFVKNLEGVDFLKGDHLTNLYTINLHEMVSASPICLMA
nr:hypothetical protein [Tanacetum cinerariifolium]